MIIHFYEYQGETKVPISAISALLVENRQKSA